jgi:PAS domain S-box-containing protein
MPRVLVVDDELEIRRLLKKLLEKKSQLDVETAENVAEAKQFLSDGAIDVVLSDIILPDGDGLDVLKFAKEKNEKIPVIMMTGAPNLQTATASIRGGAYDYLSKPLVSSKVLPVVERARHIKILRDEKERLEEENRKYQQELEEMVEKRTAQLKESQKKYETLVNASNDAIYVLIDNHFVFTNPKFEEILGYTDTEVLADEFTIYDIIYSQDKKFFEELEASEANLRNQRFEFRAMTKHGKMLDVEVSTAPIQYNNRDATLGVLRDMTEQKKAKDQLEKTNIKLKRAIRDLQQLVKLKTEFANNVSHEFRTPLTIIVGYVDLLLGGTFGNLPDKVLKVLQKTKDQGKQLIRLIDNVMNFSNFQYGDIHLNRTRTSLPQIVNAVVEVFESKAKSKGIEINVEAEEELPELYIDANKIKNVVDSLLDNAIKFTDSGSIDINMQTTEDDFVLFSITDTGIGIPESEIDIIFEGFRQVDGSATRQFGGAGLGLHIAKKIVTLHGGNIWAESVPHQGSTFYFTLPME